MQLGILQQSHCGNRHFKTSEGFHSKTDFIHTYSIGVLNAHIKGYRGHYSVRDGYKI